MTPVRLLAVLLASVSAATAAPPLGGGYGAIDAPRDTDPLTLGRAFCTARIAGDPAISGIAAHLAPKLGALLEGVPPASIPWQTWPDRPGSCEVEVLNGFDNTIGVLVRITYVAPGRTWSDTLNFERTPQTWLLNNVFYESGGNLRFRLFER